MPSPTQEDERLGQLAYEAYCAQTGGVSLASGDSLPMWSALGDEFKTAWIAAARAVQATVEFDQRQEQQNEPPVRH